MYTVCMKNNTSGEEIIMIDLARKAGLRVWVERNGHLALHQAESS